MQKNYCKSVSDEDLKIFLGRVMTLLGDMDNKMERLLSLVEDDGNPDPQEEYTSSNDDNAGEWSDG